MVRTFLAINLPDKQTRQISEAIEQWRRHRAAVRWTPASRIHLTLKFLGDVHESALKSICEACRDVASKHETMELRTAVTGAFPTVKRPRILWIGLASLQYRVLHNLQQDIENTLENMGFPREERPFSPHITVGRVKSGRKIARLMEAFMAYEPDQTPFAIDSFTLYSSTLTPQGPIYRELERFSLSG